MRSFMGHDHLNDFCGRLLIKKDESPTGSKPPKPYPWLCYGGPSSYVAYGKTGWPCRLRVIQVEQFGQKVLTWKTLDDEALSVIDVQTLTD
jgi:hypothetical protein